MFMGIDPGTKGALAILRKDGSVVYLRAFKPEMKAVELVTIIKTGAQLMLKDSSSVCFMERVGYIGARPGKKGDGGKGSFTFGKVYGLLQGALISHGMLIQDVWPIMWQGRLNCLTGGNKKITHRLATALFPGIKVTHSTADALLIAEYARRVFSVDIFG